jgi:integral membrane protein (TIGR01906 family)
MKNINYLSYILIIIALPLLIIASNIRVLANEIKLYEYGIDTYNISRTTGIDRAELVKTYQHWIDYYNSKQPTPQVTVKKDGNDLKLLSQKELYHMQDVKGLIRLDYYLQVLSIIAVFVVMSVLWFRSSDKWQILRGLFWGAVVTSGIMAILAIVSLFFFDQLFLLFHIIGFSNNLWILDPTKDYLIMLFPTDFFSDVALFGFILVLIESITIGILALFILKLKKAGLIKRTSP